jgi:hypothetical protein
MNATCLVDSMHKLQSPAVQTAYLTICSRVFSITRDGAMPERMNIVHHHVAHTHPGM